MKIGVVGLGKLGLPLALVFAKAGFEIEAVEQSVDRVAEILLNNPISEPKVNKYWSQYSKNSSKVILGVNTEYDDLKYCSMVFVVVQTPSLPNHVFDTQYVEAAVRSIHKVNKGCLIVVSSTVPPKTCDRLVKIHGRIAYNPEFIKQGSIIDDFENPKFVMVGANSDEDYAALYHIWWMCGVDGWKIEYLLPLEAEIAKLALNVSFCKDITFANVIGEFCESMNADSKAVMDVVNLDKRNYQAGLGYGGVCFPRDTRCLEALAPKYAKRYMKELDGSNEDVIWKYYGQVRQSDPPYAIIGLGYKRGVPILEESQSFFMLTWLAELSGKPKVYAYDECGDSIYKQIKLKGVGFEPTIEGAIKKAQTVFFGLPIKAPPKLLKGKRVIDPWGLNK